MLGGMTTISRSTRTLTTPEDTTALAGALAPLLARGDTVLLDGPLGAGKSHFARGIIAPLLLEPEDIPSPTFTLVQTYDTGSGPLWHADLYRITGPEEAEELGLAEAFETAICLVEWPERLGPLAPPGALRLHFDHLPGVEGRSLNIEAPPEWARRIGGLLG